MLLTIILIAPLYAMVAYLWGSQKELEKWTDERFKTKENQVDHLETAIRKTIAALEIVGGFKNKNKSDKENENA